MYHLIEDGGVGWIGAVCSVCNSGASFLCERMVLSAVAITESITPFRNDRRDKAACQVSVFPRSKIRFEDKPVETRPIVLLLKPFP